MTARRASASEDHHLTTALERSMLQNGNPPTAFSAVTAEPATAHEHNVARSQ